MNFHPRTTIKGQALAEFTCADTTKVAGTAKNVEATKVVEALRKKTSILAKKDTEQWTLYSDGASNDIGFEAGIMLINLE